MLSQVLQEATKNKKGADGAQEDEDAKIDADDDDKKPDVKNDILGGDAKEEDMKKDEEEEELRQNAHQLVEHLMEQESTLKD